MPLLKNIGLQNITFGLVSASTGAAITGATLATIKSSSFVTIDNNPQAGCAGTFTEAGNGQYVYGPTQDETNGSDVGFLFAYTGAIPTNLDFQTWLVDGNGLPSVNAADIGGTLQTARDIGASVLLSPGTGTGQVSLASGAVTVGTNSDKTGYSLTQSFPTNFSSLSITSGGVVKSDLTTIKTQTVTCAAGVTVLSSVGMAHTFSYDSNNLPVVNAEIGLFDSWASLGITVTGLSALNGTYLFSSASTMAGAVMVAWVSSEGATLLFSYGQSNPSMVSGWAITNSGSSVSASYGSKLGWGAKNWTYLSGGSGTVSLTLTPFICASDPNGSDNPGTAAIAAGTIKATNSAGAELADAATQALQATSAQAISILEAISSVSGSALLSVGTINAVTSTVQFTLTTTTGAAPVVGQFLNITPAANGDTIQTKVTAINAGVYTVSVPIAGVAVGDPWFILASAVPGDLNLTITATTVQG